MYGQFGKRLLDVVFALPMLVVLSPVLVVLAVAVRLTLGSPVVFRQQRPGLGGASFTLRKFRTMADLHSSTGRHLPDEKRLSGLGRFLRRTSLDEMPELWNVLRGDMSLVGPRPLLTHYLDRYSPQQARRHEVRPGITGWAQVNGRNLLSWEEKFTHDVWYVDHLSLGLDLRILGRTVWQVLSGQAVSAPGHVTMPEFRGSDRE